MPLLGKIVVIKRNGTDGTEFPLTANCLFGRKVDCDIRIQLPQVSKEHCRIELNENKELILTNLSSVNPTRINGQVLQQAERLKHGDLITVIDRSFRFEYPPAPTPKKKRLSTPRKGDAIKVLEDQQVKSTPGTTERRKAEHSAACLKDGSNLPSSLDQHVGDVQSKGTADSTSSPFSDLCNMLKRDLASKPWKSATKAPVSRPPAEKLEPEKVSVCNNENDMAATPKSAKKQRSLNAEPTNGGEAIKTPAEVKISTPVPQGVTEKRKRRQSDSVRTPVSQKTAQAMSPKFTAQEVAQQIVLENQSPKATLKSPKNRRNSISSTSPEDQTMSPKLSEPAESEEKQATRNSPRANAGKRFQVQEVVQEIVSTSASVDEDNGRAVSKKHKSDGFPLPAPKRKRVSFGGQLSPELFDKRLPPNSPLRRGATPRRRSLGFFQTPQSLLSRASVGLTRFRLPEDVSESPKRASPKRPSSPAKATNVPKTPSPAKSPKAPTSRALSPAKSPKAPTSRALSPAKSPKAPTPRALSPAKSPKALTSRALSPAKSPKALTSRALSPAKSPKAPTPRALSPAKSPKAPTLRSSSPAKSPKAPTPRALSPAKSPKAPTLRSSSPAKSPKAPTLRSSSPAKSPKGLTPRSPSPAKAPSPKNTKTPAPSSSPATPKTPKSTKRVSSGPVISPFPSDGSFHQTPTVRGRFSVSRVGTSSPASDQVEDTAEDPAPAVKEPQKRETPKIAVRRRSGARASAKSALRNVVRSRRSGASLANLKVVSSWADVVKFGQARPPTEAAAKKPAAKLKASKQPKVPKLKTPAHRLKDECSTGHADSPATIVVGKAYLRAAQHVGAAPKVVCNVALLKKDMKMDEDFTGVADIFKTPARSRRYESGDSPKTPFSAGVATEMSAMNTPEESGEMAVSPLSVAKDGRFNAEAVTRLLQDDCGSIEKSPSLMDKSDSSGPSSEFEIQTEDQMEKEDLEPRVQTPQYKPSECLTKIKTLLRTPKQRAAPIEDLRGKLLKTPKMPKQPQQESLEGVKELLKTPKQKGTPVEDLSGLKEMMTPRVKNSPVVCAVALKRLSKTPKDKTGEQVEDFTGVKELMKTPKIKGAPVDDSFGVKRLMMTPKKKKTSNPIEDLTGIKQMMKTPKQKNEPVEDLTGIKEMMKTPAPMNGSAEGSTEVKQKTPKQKSKPAEDLTASKQIKTLLKQKSESPGDLTGIEEVMKTPKLEHEPVEDLISVRRLKTPEQKYEPVEEPAGLGQMRTPKQKSEAVDDLNSIKEMLKTLKPKSEPVEDLISIKQKMKTPKQKHERVEDQSSIQQVMEKQKNGPVEDLTGLKQMMKTPKQNRKSVGDLPSINEVKTVPKQPAEDDFDISTLMKTPKQSVGVEADSTHLVGLVNEPTAEMKVQCQRSGPPEMQEHLAVATKATAVWQEDKAEVEENICPVEDLKSDLQVAVVMQNFPQTDVDKAPETLQADLKPALMEDSVEEPVAAAAVASVPLSAPARGRRCKTLVLVEAGRSPARKPARGKPIPTGAVLKTPPAPAQAKRGRKANQESGDPSAVPASGDPERAKGQAPAGKRATRKNQAEPAVGESDVTSANCAAADEARVKANGRPRRGKATKKANQDEEANVAAPVNDESEIKSSESLADEAAPGSATEVTVKSNSRSKRGGVTKKTLIIAQANEPDVSFQGEAAPEKEPEVTVKSRTRSKRGKPTEKDAEAAVVNETNESPEEPQKPDTGAPVKSHARTRRGKVTNQDTQKTKPEEAPEPTPESSIQRSEADANAGPDAAVKSSTSSRRGRPTKMKTPQIKVPHSNEDNLKNSGALAEAGGPESFELELSTETAAPIKSRSGRGRTTKRAKWTEETKEQTPVNKEMDVKSTDAPVETPVVKPGRGRRMKPVELKPAVELETEQKPLAARSGRGPKSKVTKDEPLPSAAATKTERLPQKTILRGGRRTKQPKAPAAEETQEKVGDELENAAVTIRGLEAPATRAVRGKITAVLRDEPEARVNRGRRVPAADKPGRRRKATSKPALEETAEESEIKSPSTQVAPPSRKDAAKKGKGRPAKKTKVSSKDASAEEESGVGFQCQVNASKKVKWNSDLVTWKNTEDLEPAQTSNKEQPTAGEASAEPPAKGRRGRAAKKQDPEKNKPSAEETVPPARRGRAGASAVSTAGGDETSRNNGQKRKLVEVTTEQAQEAESLPKRRRGKAAGAGDAPDAEATETKSENAQPARGRRKAAQDSKPAASKAEEPDARARRGTRAQRSTVSTPVRRSSRK